MYAPTSDLAPSDPALSDPSPPELQTLRAEIDRLDLELLDVMAARLRVASETLDVKRAHGLLAVDVRREARVVARGAALARERGLDPELVRDIFWRLIELSRRAQRAREQER